MKSDYPNIKGDILKAAASQLVLLLDQASINH